MTDQEEKRCATCKFFHAYEKRSMGYDGNCRRYPPKVTHDDRMECFDGIFPPVLDEEWCGEWQKKEPSVSHGH